MFDKLLPRFISLILVLCLLFLPLLPAWSEVTSNVEQQISESEQWSESIKHWDAVFDKTDDYLKTNILDDVISEELYSSLNTIRLEALALKSKVEAQQKAISNLTAALGSKPTDDEPAESVIISSKRSEYGDQLSLYREQLAQIDLALVRTSEFSDGLSSLRHGVLVKKLLTQLPSPIDPNTLYKAVSESITHLQTLLLAPRNWYASLTTDERERLAVWPTVLVSICSLIIGLFMRAWIISAYGRDVLNENPSPTLKITAAIAEGVGRGVVPLLVLLGLALWVAQHTSAPDDLFANILHSAFRASIYFVVFSSLLNAVLSPSHPSWRLVNITPASTRVIGSAALLLLGVVALDMLIIGSTASILLSNAVQSVYLSLVAVLKASLILVISIGPWWENTKGVANEEQDNLEQSDAETTAMDYIRRFIVVFCLTAATAALFGYVKLAAFLVDNLIDSALIAFLAYGVHAILVEIINAILNTKLVRLRLGMRIQTLQRIKLWGVGLITVVTCVLALASILIEWGVAAEDMYRWVIYLFTGFTVGSITISLTEILLAIMVFVGVMAITKLIQRALMGSVLPKFTSNQSVQHSLSSGTGYVGILVACTMFIAALGIKLESIALVAGALSVGIGFGLQNIVNNFVSGLILILERPIKVGDWVSVGGNEGTIQQINFRATELETFTRATVIIPNSEMLSNSLTNMTYHDKTSRVEILVQVGYDSDPTTVMNILVDAANLQSQVLRYPEAFALLMDFGADGLNFELRCYIRDATSKSGVSSEIRLKILEELHAAGIDLPYPQRVLHMAKPSEQSGDHSKPILGS